MAKLISDKRMSYELIEWDIIQQLRLKIIEKFAYKNIKLITSLVKLQECLLNARKEKERR